MPTVQGLRAEVPIHAIVVVTVLLRDGLLFVEDLLLANSDFVEIDDAVCGSAVIGAFEQLVGRIVDVFIRDPS